MAREKGPIRAELDIFSGRPNPTWSLNDEQARELLARLKQLTPKASSRALYDGLGYRGFKLTGFQDFDEVVVQNEIVEARRGARRYQWLDEARNLETYLLNTSKAHVGDDLYRFTASAMAEPD
jgi:hypothetical protein